MADQKPVQHAPEPKQADPPKPEPKKEPAGPLGSAGASSNPLVHQLLAERAIMTSEGVDDKAAVKALDKKLADLGVSVES